VSVGQIPGFFGKVSMQGDFVARRLPPEFIGTWDRWLQQGLQKSREQLGPAWLDTYLTSPVWRFALAPELCGSDAWAGVLMPSVDRVGRHFPLTVCAPLQSSILHCPSGAKEWHDRVESLALHTLDKDYGIDAFEADLAVLPALSSGPAVAKVGKHAPSNRQYRLAIPGLRQLGDSDYPGAEDISRLGLNVRSLWWSDGSSHVAPSLLVCEGMPAPASFAAMLDGQWVRCGWQVRPA
jgi:type VI secretion system protein ImpM